MRKTTGLLGAMLLAGCGGPEPEAAADNAAAEVSAPAAAEAPPANLAAPEPEPDPVAPEEAPPAAAKPPEAPEKAAPEVKAPAAAAAASPPAEAMVKKAAVPAARPASFAMCQACHSTSKGEPHRVGPNLFGVLGAKAGSKSGYNYSAAMKESGVVWTRDRLDAFLAAPRSVVPGTKMIMAGPKDAAKRKELVDYLASLR